MAILNKNLSKIVDGQTIQGREYSQITTFEISGKQGAGQDQFNITLHEMVYEEWDDYLDKPFVKNRKNYSITIPEAIYNLEQKEIIRRAESIATSIANGEEPTETLTEIVGRQEFLTQFMELFYTLLNEEKARQAAEE